MTARRPSFQFYPADWLGNTNLRRCTHAEKGAWLDVMCLLHDSADQYGALRWPLADIALAAGCDVATLQALIDKGVMKGADAGQTCEVFVYVPRSGRKDGEPVTLIAEQEGPLWYSSRMVRDEYVNQIRGSGSRFGSPTRRVGEEIGERQGVHPTHHPDQHPGRHPTFNPNGDSAGDEHGKPAKPQDSPSFGGFDSPTRRVGEEFGERQGDGSSASASTSASQEERQGKPALSDKKSKKKAGLTFSEWVEQGGDVAGDKHPPVLAFAERVGLPTEWVELGWTQFKRDHIDRQDKRQLDWLGTFANYVRKGWLGIWQTKRDGGYYLTTQGAMLATETGIDAPKESGDGGSGIGGRSLLVGGI